MNWFSIFCIPKNSFSVSFTLKIFFEKLKIKKTEINIINFFFENSFEIKKLEKIRNVKVTKVCIANLKTGEKFNQKSKLKIVKSKRVIFFLNNKWPFSFFF